MYRNKERFVRSTSAGFHPYVHDCVSHQGAISPGARQTTGSALDKHASFFSQANQIRAINEHLSRSGNIDHRDHTMQPKRRGSTTRSVLPAQKLYGTSYIPCLLYPYNRLNPRFNHQNPSNRHPTSLILMRWRCSVGHSKS